MNEYANRLPRFSLKSVLAVMTLICVGAAIVFHYGLQNATLYSVGLILLTILPLILGALLGRLLPRTYPRVGIVALTLIGSLCLYGAYCVLSLHAYVLGGLLGAIGAAYCALAYYNLCLYRRGELPAEIEVDPEELAEIIKRRRAAAQRPLPEHRYRFDLPGLAILTALGACYWGMFALHPGTIFVSTMMGSAFIAYLPLWISGASLRESPLQQICIIAMLGLNVGGALILFDRRPGRTPADTDRWARQFYGWLTQWWREQPVACTLTTLAIALAACAYVVFMTRLMRPDDASVSHANEVL